MLLCLSRLWLLGLFQEFIAECPKLHCPRDTIYKCQCSMQVSAVSSWNDIIKMTLKEQFTQKWKFSYLPTLPPCRRVNDEWRFIVHKTHQEHLITLWRKPWRKTDVILIPHWEKSLYKQTLWCYECKLSHTVSQHFNLDAGQVENGILTLQNGPIGVHQTFCALWTHAFLTWSSNIVQKCEK